MSTLFQVPLRKKCQQGSGFCKWGLRDVGSPLSRCRAWTCSLGNAVSAVVSCPALTGLLSCLFSRIPAFLGKSWMSSHWKAKPFIVLPCDPRNQLHHKSCSMHPKDFWRMSLCSLLSFLAPSLPSIWHVQAQVEKSQLACLEQMPNLDKIIGFLSSSTSSYQYLLSIHYVRRVFE